jgi:hypothetical protein
MCVRGGGRFSQLRERVFECRYIRKMLAALKRLHSPDVFDLESFYPADYECFGFLLQAMFGTEGDEGEDSFDMIVCTPKWLEQKLAERVIFSGRHHLIVKEYSFITIRSFLEKYARRCSGETWQEVAQKLSRVGRWEFEDYVP